MVSSEQQKRTHVPANIPNEIYEAELFRLQTEFVKLQEWVRFSGARIVVISEGRDVKKHARLNMMAHLLSTIDYRDVKMPKVKLPTRPAVSDNYVRPPRELSRYVDDHVATLMAPSE
jgi:hypothetical protein